MHIVGGNYIDYDEKEQMVKIPVESEYQHRAMMFLGEHVFTTPEWLLKPMLTGKVENDPLRFMELVQSGVLAMLVGKGSSLPEGDSVGIYTRTDFFEDLNRIIWQDVLSGVVPDVYRQNLQRNFLRQVSSYGSRGGPQAIKLYKGYLASVKEKLEQVGVENTNERFGIYCRNLIRGVKKFLK